jgi:flagellar biosynthesis chaperone FliJ
LIIALGQREYKTYKDSQSSREEYKTYLTKHGVKDIDMFLLTLEESKKTYQQSLDETLQKCEKLRDILQNMKIY